VLPGALWYRERVKEAWSTVSGHRSSSTLVAIGYIALDIGTQAFPVVLRGDQLECLGFTWVRGVERCMNKPEELRTKVVVFRNY
jgi:hypothetical protein